jgi:long-subunit fatty acid transport protein
MKLLLVAGIFFSLNSYANFPEMFGASSSTSGLANQFNDNENDPSNNYYAPALLSSSKRPELQLSANYNQSYFKEIQNVTVRNSVNSESSNEIGNVDTSYPALLSNSLHLSLPILGETGNKFAVSVFAPGKNLQEMSSGDAFLPEYVMYRSRNSRTTVHFNFIVPLDEGWSYSIGAFSGLQISGETEIAARYNGSGKNSTAKMKAVAKPSLSPIISIAKRHSLGTLILTYQHQMKNKMQIHAVGSTRDPALNFPYDFTMSSLLYFDPSTLRLGESWKIKNGKFFTTLEYQYWKSYSPSTISIEQNGGFIVGTGNYGTTQMRNIIIPKVGYEFNVHDHLIAQMGLAYRQTPIKGDFSGAGNAIDTDSLIYSLGLLSKMNVLTKMVELSGSLQVHELQNKSVQKSSGNEDGNAGNKIGSPGYDIGGSIINLALGMKVEF